MLNEAHSKAQKLSIRADSLIREACLLWEEAAKLEEAAAKSLPKDQPRGRKILTTSYKAMKYKAKTLAKLFGKHTA